MREFHFKPAELYSNPLMHFKDKLMLSDTEPATSRRAER